MMPKQELILPQRREVALQPDVAAFSNLPGMYVGGPVEAMFQRWEADRRTKTLGALTRQRIAETALVDAATNAAHSYVRNLEALARVADTPRRLAHHYALLDMAREEERRQAEHVQYVGQLYREREVTLARATVVDARVTLLEAEQRLEAQQRYGMLPHELAHEKQRGEMLLTEIENDEREQALYDYEDEPEATSDETPADEVLARLYSVRDQLAGLGQDTDQIEAAIAELEDGE